MDDELLKYLPRSIILHILLPYTFTDYSQDFKEVINELNYIFRAGIGYYSWFDCKFRISSHLDLLIIKPSYQKEFLYICPNKLYRNNSIKFKYAILL